jgi:hypothetical protein
VNEALANAHSRDPIPKLPPPSSPEEGARDLVDLLVTIESFGLPKADAKPTRYFEMLL